MSGSGNVERTYSGMHVLVFGTGISGVAAARFLIKSGADVWIYDKNEQLDKAKLAAVICREEEGGGSGRLRGGIQGQNHDNNGDDRQIFEPSRIMTGVFPGNLLQSIQLCVVSPGVPTDCDEVLSIKAAGIPVIGEVELAFQNARGMLTAITGTNGKTTTTALAGELIRLGGFDTHVVGNIGTPYIDVVDQLSDNSVCVAELSSFQLESIDTLHPHISAVLNMTPDHLDRHHTMEEYAGAKKRIAQNQTPEDYCILNYDDALTRAMADDLAAKVVWFSSREAVPHGCYIEGDCIYIKWEGAPPVCLTRTDQLQLLGTHNYENVMAAALIALLSGVALEDVISGVRGFSGVAHRIEYVDEIEGVAFYNDSKGTNTDAAIRAVKAMNRPTVLIGGGYDKDASYEEWIRSFSGRITALVLVGQTKEKIRECAVENGFNRVVMCDTFEEAFSEACKQARPGDAVLLSPACASWGMFPNYEARGDLFKSLVAQYGCEKKGRSV